MLAQVLKVIIQQKATATVIAPMWKGYLGYNQLIKINIKPPIQLKNQPLNFIQMNPWLLPDPIQNYKWKIFAWHVSGKKG